MATLALPAAGTQHFDQIHSEVIAALRKERVGFFVMVSPGPEPQFGFSVNGSSDDARGFLMDVIWTAQAELDDIDAQMERIAREAKK